MHILYFIGAYGRQYAANEIHYELGREFVREGHTCRILAPISRKDLGDGPLSFQDGEVAVERFLIDATRSQRLLNRLSWLFSHYAYFLQCLWQYRRLLRRHPEIDVVHADAAYPMGAIAALAGGRPPIVISVHGGDVIRRPDYGYGRFARARALTRWAFRRAALVRINSPLTAGLAEERGCPRERMRLLEVNIGDRFFLPGQGDLAAHRRTARERVCRDLGLPPDVFLLLSLGRLIPLKGVEEVVRATAQLLQELPQAHTLIAGPSRNVPGIGDYRAYLEGLAASLGVAERITFVGGLGYEEEVPRYLAAADLFLSPSHVEGLNRVVAEAGALGTPSIVSQGTGIAPLVEEMGAGRVVPVGDADALAEAVVRMAAEPESLREMAGRSRGLARRFRSRAVALGLLEMYGEAIRQGLPRLVYIAYPTSLVLKSANAVQTYLTCRNLRQLAPDTLIVVPRWLRQPSRFSEVGAVHLPRLAVGKFSRFWRTTLLYYLERSLFAFQVVGYLLLQRLRGRPCHVLYVREVICAFWLLRLRRLLGARVVYEAHDLESRNPSRAKERWVQPWLRRLDRSLLQKADGVVSLTATFAHYLEEKGWRPADQVTVIPDAYDEALFRPLDQADCRSELDIPQEAQVMLYAGLTFSYRGLEQLVEAFARLSGDFPRARLYLVGGRPSEIAPLRAQAEALGVANRLLTPGQVPLEVVPRYLNAADLLVIPGTVTDETASPLKMFEYMAVEIPLVSVDRPALREIIPPDAARYFSPGDGPALEEALRDTLSHPQAAAARAAVAREAVQRYTYRWRAERILQLVCNCSGP